MRKKKISSFELTPEMAHLVLYAGDAAVKVGRLVSDVVRALEVSIPEPMWIYVSVSYADEKRAGFRADCRQLDVAVDKIKNLSDGPDRVVIIASHGTNQKSAGDVMRLELVCRNDSIRDDMNLARSMQITDTVMAVSINTGMLLRYGEDGRFGGEEMRRACLAACRHMGVYYGFLEVELAESTQYGSVYGEIPIIPIGKRIAREEAFWWSLTSAERREHARSVYWGNVLGTTLLQKLGWKKLTDELEPGQRRRVCWENEEIAIVFLESVGDGNVIVTLSEEMCDSSELNGLGQDVTSGHATSCAMLKRALMGLAEGKSIELRSSGERAKRA